MHAPAHNPRYAGPQYHGLRMTADEYFALEEDGYRYELIDGVICLSPSPTPLHQQIAVRIAALLDSYLENKSDIHLSPDTDVHLGETPDGRDIVYRPDIVVFRAKAGEPIPDRIQSPPLLVVEVLSPGTRQFDLKTKRADYERAGVQEYWIVDPQDRAFTFLRLTNGRYEEMQAGGDRFESKAVPGFVLELDRVRKAFG